MLVLTRRIGEAVKIGDDIEVSVVSIEGNRVRLGFVAPKEVRIARMDRPGAFNPQTFTPSAAIEGGANQKEAS